MGVLCNTSKDNSGKSLNDQVIQSSYDVDDISDSEMDSIVEHPIITGGQHDPVLLKRTFDGSRISVIHRGSICVSDNSPVKNTHKNGHYLKR